MIAGYLVAMTSDESEHYRREQEEFVSNHGGSSSREVLLAILPNVCSIFLTATTLALVGKRVDRNVRTLIEFCLSIVPCVLCCTILSESVVHICFAMITISIVNVVIFIAQNRIPSKTFVRSNVGRRPFVTNFRALTNLISVICILAVDFRIFPRRFAKTEIYGYSLMDTGVGLFVVANALVAPESRNIEGPRGRSVIQKMTSNSKTCVKNSAPLLILGFGRFLAIEYSSYQTHVTEYGVHWNFFVTLAFVKMLTSTISSIANLRYSLLLGVSIISMHEYALSAGGLKYWVLGDSPRNDFVSANREGLSSVPGYVGIYLIAVAIGRLIHSTYKSHEKCVKLSNNERYFVNFRVFGRQVEFEYTDSMILCVKLSLIAVQACAATLFCDHYFRVSRRLANAGYCFWIVTLSCTLLTLALLVEIKTDIIASIGGYHPHNTGKKDEDGGKKKKRVGFRLDDLDNEESIKIRTLEIFEAVNYNGLTFFLLANLFTGVVNMSIKTLYVDTNEALLIIFVYIASCILLIIILYRFKIQLKL
ncbi:uncharacterized protein At4g17910-like [Venturia canescens]|uniref:uncharacterized protein At4g17910-like n=1 Tax=Venturia canescens TaxID=32260 RepID=UPI001C9C3116|nr:uncharacterized protein At4g17910-like [Venturia canescens]